MQEKPESFGEIIKRARESQQITAEAFAERLGISVRYLYKLEDEGKTPSYGLLVRIIRLLGISADLIFYPEKPSKDSEVENLIRQLYDCDERSLEVVKATTKALIDTAPKKQP